MQHRGQEGCGIVSYDGNNFYSEKRQGLVGDHFTDPNVIKKLPGKSAIGHNRYSTTGEVSIRNIQPFFADLYSGGMSLAHNGNLTNAIELRNNLVKDEIKLIQEQLILFKDCKAPCIVFAEVSGSIDIMCTSAISWTCT